VLERRFTQGAIVSFYLVQTPTVGVSTNGALDIVAKRKVIGHKFPEQLSSGFGYRVSPNIAPHFITPLVSPRG